MSFANQVICDACGTSVGHATFEYSNAWMLVEINNPGPKKIAYPEKPYRMFHACSWSCFGVVSDRLRNLDA